MLIQGYLDKHKHADQGREDIRRPSQAFIGFGSIIRISHKFFNCTYTPPWFIPTIWHQHQKQERPFPPFPETGRRRIAQQWAFLRLKLPWTNSNMSFLTCLKKCCQVSPSLSPCVRKLQNPGLETLILQNASKLEYSRPALDQCIFAQKPNLKGKKRKKKKKTFPIARHLSILL